MWCRAASGRESECSMGAESLSRSLALQSPSGAAWRACSVAALLVDRAAVHGAASASQRGLGNSCYNKGVSARLVRPTSVATTADWQSRATRPVNIHSCVSRGTVEVARALRSPTGLRSYGCRGLWSGRLSFQSGGDSLSGVASRSMMTLRFPFLASPAGRSGSKVWPVAAPQQLWQPQSSQTSTGA